MKVKVNKVVPATPQLLQKSKSKPVLIGNHQYITAPTRLQQNFTGFPIYLQLICTLPDNDYDYLKINVKAENTDYKQVVGKKQQSFKEIKKGQTKKSFVFNFTPPFKGNYRVQMDNYYKMKNFIQGSQPSEQKKETMQIAIKCEEPFQVSQKIIDQDKSGSISFPLFLQYTIESKYPESELQFVSSFYSQKFNSKCLHQQNAFKLKKQQAYYTVFELQPKGVKEILNQKGITLGTFKLEYGSQGKYQKKTTLKPTDKYIFFKGQTITKKIPKKDISIIKLRFSKIYNVNFCLNNMRLIIDEKDASGIKIIKTSKDVVNLDQRMSQQIEISVICLKSGFFHLKGLSLQTPDSRTVNYCNQMTFEVQNQYQEKQEQVFQKTAVIQIDSLL